jgi:hypothetical protein
VKTLSADNYIYVQKLIEMKMEIAEAYNQVNKDFQEA